MTLKIRDDLIQERETPSRNHSYKYQKTKLADLKHLVEHHAGGNLQDIRKYLKYKEFPRDMRNEPKQLIRGGIC